MAQFKAAAALADRPHRRGTAPLSPDVEGQKQYPEAVEALPDTRLEAPDGARDLQRLEEGDFGAVRVARSMTVEAKP